MCLSLKTKHRVIDNFVLKMWKLVEISLCDLCMMIPTALQICYRLCRLVTEVMEDEEDDADTDLERQNVEELYDSVRHQHQREVQGKNLDVQHEALVPVLRPYQSQAVNWMLWREKYNNSASESKD